LLFKVVIITNIILQLSYAYNLFKVKILRQQIEYRPICENTTNN